MHKCTPPIEELQAIQKHLELTKDRTPLEEKMLKAINVQIKGLTKPAK